MTSSIDKLSVLISSMHGTNGNIIQLGVDSDRPRLPPALPQCPFLSTYKSEATTVVGETDCRCCWCWCWNGRKVIDARRGFLALHMTQRTQPSSLINVQAAQAFVSPASSYSSSSSSLSLPKTSVAFNPTPLTPSTPLVADAGSGVASALAAPPELRHLPALVPAGCTAFEGNA